MRSITLFDDLPDLVLIEIFSYLSSFDILWGLSGINQHITSLLAERHYFRCINLSSAHYYQFNILLQILLLNEIESVIIAIDSSPIQLSQWPYLPRLTTLTIKGVREYNDVIIFLILHAATLINLTIHTNNEIISTGLSLKLYYPLSDVTDLVKNIILRQMPALRLLDLGTTTYNRILDWHVNHTLVPLTYIRIVLDNPNDLLRLISTRPLSTTLQHLHVKLTDIRRYFNSYLQSRDQFICMSQLQTFTFVKSCLWKSKNELTFVEMLTGPDVMPMLQRINLSITLNNEELNHIKQCSIFNDYRSVDVHFALCIDDFCQNVKFKDLIPRGSLSHPREVVGSFFSVNEWPHIGYSTIPHLDMYSSPRLRSCILWYTLPWSFEEFFQLIIPNRCIYEREIYASPSSSNKIIPSNVQILNERNNRRFLPNPVDFRTITLENHDQGHSHHINSTFCVTIPSYRIIDTNCLDILNSCIFTTNLRSIHIRFRFSSRFVVINWNSLDTLSVLPLLKSLRLTVYDLETQLEDKDCQIIVKRLSMLTDFIFCFRRNTDSADDGNDSFDIHRKSISNLHRHIDLRNDEIRVLEREIQHLEERLKYNELRDTSMVASNIKQHLTAKKIQYSKLKHIENNLQSKCEDIRTKKLNLF